MLGAGLLVLGALLHAVGAAPGSHTPAPRTQPPRIASLPIPATVAELAAASGIERVDGSTLPLDLVRMAFASPDGQEERKLRAALTRLLQRDGTAAWLPLPMSPKTWGAHVFRARVSDSRLAAAIFGSRSAALLYHGLMGVEPATLAWMESNPAVLDTLQRHAGVTAVYARSLRIRNGRVITPGDAADDVWAALVGESPGAPAAFIAKLWSSRSGRLAGLYDAIAHLDPAHQAFAIGKAGEMDRIARARNLLDAITVLEPQWRLADHPFRRPDVDAAALLRAVRVSADGALAPPASRETWSRVFGGVTERGAADAAWLARGILEAGDSVARQRLDVFLFAQRALSTARGDDEAVVEALTAFGRYPALMLTLEAHAFDARTLAAAARAAAALTNRDAIAVFQAGLAIVDRARRAGTLDALEARAAIASLIDSAKSPEASEGLLSWVRDTLLPALTRSVNGSTESRDPDALVMAAMAGPSPRRGAPIEWEGQRYHVDLAAAELRRLTTLRASQEEVSIGQALAAATARDLSALAHSMMALVYADALGEPEGQPAAAGAVWRKHRFEGSHGGDAARPVAWRLASEVFAPQGWHLAGSVLRLDLALAHLALRRLDSTEMPMPSALPASSRRTLALSVALIDPRALADEERDAIAAALARGRARAVALSKDPSGFDSAAADAGLSEWRANAARWTLGTGSSPAVAGAFTLLELFRLGGGQPSAAWGAAAVPVDGCLCLRFPERAAWEDLAGRPASGQMATQLADVMLRTAVALAARRLPAVLARDVAAFAMQDAIDRARTAYLDDWLPVAYAARDLTESQFDDYVAALTVDGPLVPIARGVR